MTKLDIAVLNQDITVIRKTYEHIAKERKLPQLHTAISLKVIQSRAGIHMEKFISILSYIQRINNPGIELGFARNQRLSLRVPTMNGLIQRYSSIAFHS